MCPNNPQHFQQQLVRIRFILKNIHFHDFKAMIQNSMNFQCQVMLCCVRIISLHKIRCSKTVADSENVPISLDMEKVWHKRDDGELQIRTNPPSPQCFSNVRAPYKIPASSKASRSRLKVCNGTIMNDFLKLDEVDELL